MEQDPQAAPPQAGDPQAGPGAGPRRHDPDPPSDVHQRGRPGQAGDRPLQR